MKPSEPSDEARVLIIYTGGTIGMLLSAQGYVPEPFFLTEILRGLKRFHDPLEDSFYSQGGSVQGYREWSSSGISTPLTSGTTTPPTPPATQHSTLLVRSSRPIGKFQAPGSTEMQCCEEVSDGVYQARLPSLVTPHSNVPGQHHSKRVRYAILEWDPLLDSSNIGMTDWIRMATEIELNYTSFDAFVILHGTDTMSYTSSALGFLLEDLGKTIIVTGAQIPLSQVRNDAVDNLLGALSIAGNYIIPECCLYFNHVLHRGNRVSKTSSHDLNAFHSPNFSPLVNVGIDITVNWNNVLRQTNLHRFKAHKDMNPHVAALRLFPGITAAAARAFLSPPTRGVVLQTFGSGNAPQRADLMDALKEACDAGIIIVAISQCMKGSVSTAYETGKKLQQAGVVPGGDMTPECALTKLSYLLSKPELSVTQVRELIGVPLRGELTRPSVSTPSNPATANGSQDMDGLLSNIVRLTSAIHQSYSTPLSPEMGEVAQDAAARWSNTAAETASTEAALLPYLMLLAAARNDVAGIDFCLNASNARDAEGKSAIATIPGGIVNCLEPGSMRSPLHVTALNGGAASVTRLLKAGALVHLRDNLGHTALYYAARQGHVDIVDILITAGATLGGVEYETGCVSIGLESALNSGNSKAVRAWNKVDKLTEKP